MFEKYENLINGDSISRTNFLEFVKQYIDANNNIDFEKLEADGQLEEYQFLARESSQSGLKLKLFEEFLKEKGNVVDPKNVNAKGTELEGQIERARKYDDVTLADFANPAARDENGNLIPSQYFVTFGDAMYDVTGKSLDEQIAIYRAAMETELEKAVGKELSMEEKEIAIQKLCAEIYGTRETVLSSNDLLR